MTWAAIMLALVGRVVFSFVDPAVEESSGLVDLGATMVTTNDSGGDPLVFLVDSRSGRTVGRTTFAAAVEDVEALAPAGRGAVWVGDIGDNAETRDRVRVYRVEVRRGDHTVDAPAYELEYPDGAHDAESLVADGEGRLVVITKGLLGGTAYVAPRHLDPDGVNRLRAVARVDVWATDAALFPDGRHVLVRGYDTAVVSTFPAFTPVATVDLPRQRQGEGVSIGESGRVRLSSEGVHSPVLEVELPAPLRAAVEPQPSPTPTPAAAATAGASAGASADSSSGIPLGAVAAGKLALLALIGLGVVLVRRRRRGVRRGDHARPR